MVYRMFINFTPVNFQHKSTKCSVQNQRITTTILAPLQHDTVSFGAMKKKQFEGVDFAVVEKFKPPIEKFNSNDDLQNWAGDKANAIANKNFGGRQKETKFQRKAILKEWSDYVFKENDAYKNTTALLILNAITKDLEPDNDNIPPVLNKGVLADCIYEIDKNTKSDPKYRFDLNKMYQNKLRAFYMDDTDTNTGETATKWIVIPSKVHDPENFEANVEKLKALSYKTWCTKSNNAEPYLAKGDFHVYLENGKPKLGVRFVGDEIQEIQGEQNNNKIPWQYFDVIEKHINENLFKLTENAENEITSAKKIKNEIDKIKADLKDAIKNNDTKTIFNYLGIDAKEDKDGYLTISKYEQPSSNFTFNDLGIDENKMLLKVKIIDGDGDFRFSQVTNLGNLESIGGDAVFTDSQLTNLGKLKSIGGNVYFNHSMITDLGNLKSIGGNAIVTDSQLTNLGKLKSIDGNVYFNHSMITDLGDLEYIGGNAIFTASQLTNLGKLKSIGGDAVFTDSQLTNLGKLKSIGGDAVFTDSQLTDLGYLKTIKGTAYYTRSMVKDLGDLESIGKKAYFNNSQITNLGKLKSIGGYADFSNSQVTDLANLESIDGDADFSDSQVITLGKLKSIGGKAIFYNSRITTLGNLEFIGKYADFSHSQVTSLGKLKSVGGNVYILSSPLKRIDFANIEVGGTIDID